MTNISRSEGWRYSSCRLVVMVTPLGWSMFGKWSLESIGGPDSNLL